MGHHPERPWLLTEYALRADLHRKQGPENQERNQIAASVHASIPQPADYPSGKPETLKFRLFGIV
ncbi:MAG TPA: hypothetical protein VIE65_22845 [Methylobacter sp.]|jgi:hypothetical protein